jgi:hypothetical protein
MTKLSKVLGIILVVLLLLVPGVAQEETARLYGGGTFVPGQNISLEYYLPSGRANITLYRIANPEKILELGGPEEFKESKQLKLERIRTVPIYLRGSYRNLNLGKLPTGFYFAQIVGSKPGNAVLILVSDLGLIVKSDGRQILTYTANLNTGQPIQSRVWVVHQKKIGAEGYSSEQGVATVQNPAESTGDIVVAARAGNLWAFSNAYWNSWANTTNRVYLQTDRPVYRAGDKVLFKGIARRAADLKPVAGQKVAIAIEDPDSSEVYSTTATTDSFGSFVGEFKLGLDARTGSYGVSTTIGEETDTTFFGVQEYVKPEYRVSVTPSSKVAVQGDKVKYLIKGEYLFGGPVSGGKVAYSLLQRSYYRWSYRSSYGFYQVYDYDSDYEANILDRGEGVLNEKGEMEIEVALPKADGDYRLTLDAGVTDEARREERGSGATVAYRSGVSLNLEIDSYAYKAGDTIRATVRAEDIEGKPVAVPFSLKAERSYWVRGKGEQNQTTALLKGSTNAEGKARIEWKLNTQGSYELLLESQDAQNRPASASDYVWVSDGSYWFWNYESIRVTPDKFEYKPGDTARFVIESPVTDGYALITMEGSSLGKPEVIAFKGSVFTYEVKVTEAMYPNAFIGISVIGGGKYYYDTAGVLVPPAERFLNVDITPDKETYKPGEDAVYSIKVTDLKGNPVKAQLALGLVDEAIYLIRPDTSDIRGFFYQQRDNVVSTENASNLYFGYAAPVELAKSAPAPMSEAVFGQNKESEALAQPRLRQDFRDTAYWLPLVQTDEQGRASTTLKLPDNLTQWRMTARAVTLGNTVGQNARNITSTLPVIARLATPRFLVRGDQASLRVIGQNNLPIELKGKLEFVTQNLLLQSPGSVDATLPANGRTQADYSVVADKTGSATLKASALTTVSSDALQRPLPVAPKGLREEIGWAGEIQLPTTKSAGLMLANRLAQGGSTSWKFTLPENTDAGSIRGKVYLTPSLAAAVTPALQYLAGYPYGCSEQTMSRFLPSVLAKQAGDLAQLPESLTRNLDEFVQVGLKRLYDFQHEDGGWGFWTYDESSMYISAHVLSGLVQAREAGYAVREEVLRNGAAFLARKLGGEGSNELAADARAYAYYALALGGVDYLKKPEGKAPRWFVLLAQGNTATAGLDRVLEAKDITAYGLAYAALAYAEAGQRAQANRVLDRLLSLVIERERIAYWESGAPEYAWNDDRTEATARALQALSMLRSNHPVISKVVNWLLLERKNGYYWYSTKDTAAVIQAALVLAKVRKEGNADLSVKIKVNGQALAEQTLSGSARKGIEVSLSNLAVGDNTVDIESSGSLYTSANVSFVPERDYLTPEYKGLRVARAYESLEPSYDAQNGRFSYSRVPLKQAPKVGEYVLVTLTLRPESKYARYVIMNEPLPAGYSLVEADDAFRIGGISPRYGWDYYGWNYWYDGRDVRDQRVDYYFSYLSGPVTFTYILRAETPGSFTALPTQAWMMYEPEVRGVGTVKRVAVSE